MPARSIVGDDRNQRPLQRLVDGRHALGGEARLQHHPQAQRDVGVFGGVLGRLVERHLPANVFSDFLAPGACSITCSNDMQRVAEVALGESVHAVLARAAVERVGQQHRVVERRDVDAVAAQHQRVVLDVLADLEDRRRLPAAASAAPALRGSGAAADERRRRRSKSLPGPRDGRAARSRPRPARSPARSRRGRRASGRDSSVSVSKATRPAARARRDPGFELRARRDSLVLASGRSALARASAAPAATGAAGVAASGAVASGAAMLVASVCAAASSWRRPKRRAAAAPRRPSLRRCASSAC